jgi:hypothetical protein
MLLTNRSESSGAVGDKGALRLGHTVGKGELELRCHELLDVWAADVLRLLDLNHTENL